MVEKLVPTNPDRSNHQVVHHSARESYSTPRHRVSLQQVIGGNGRGVGSPEHRWLRHLSLEFIIHAS